MPIRMTDDQPDQPDQYSNDDGGGGGGGRFPGGGGGLLGLLPLLFSLFRGRGIFVLIILAIAGYFFFGRGGCSGGGGGLLNQVSQLATGGILDPKQFQKANIYESLEADDNKNPLPEAVNLQRYAPGVGNQGQQGSCVAWSSAYGARTIVESARTGQDPNQLRFSPAFLYNNIKLDGCNGSYIIRAMEFMTQQGAVPYDRFPYRDDDCERQAPSQLFNDASQFKMRGFNRLTSGDNVNNLDIRAIKENLAQGAPVVIGMMVGQSYMQPMMGKDVWDPEPDDASMMGFGGHAQCVVGYDDKKYGGAFLIMNSWGPEWGNNGFAWVRYQHFKRYVREAYGLEPMQKVGAAANEPFSCDIGLMEVQYNGQKTVTKGYIPLRVTSANRFETQSPITSATRFKMEVKNTTECYVYVFGKETDGTSYTLFPYPDPSEPTKSKYSPFCGITGYRLFPKNKSMQPDSIGRKDMIAIVVSKQPLDWYKLNQTLSQNPQADYANRVNSVLGSQLIRNLNFQANNSGAIHFESPAGNNQVAACVVEIDKN
ncbi:MAG: peptidase C1A papain [Bacteroidetes bacterium]|nr:MAG: peptidase C1A papain [Bacteroidota bacterium]